MPGNGIDQRSTEVTTARMHHHACRFIDDHQVVIFIDHIQRDVLWFDRCIIVWTVKHQSNDIPRAYLIITFYWRTIYLNKTSFCCFLNPVTTGMRLMLGDILIYSDRHLSLVHLHPEVFI